MRPARRGGTLAWCTAAALLLLPSLFVAAQPPAGDLLSWRPLDWPGQPWRAWTAAWVHLSAMHLRANLVGGVLVVALGVAARVDRRAALAWLLAWPLAHIGLLLMPELQRYGGLSGVLHAGVAVVAVVLGRRGAGAERRIGLAIAAGLVLKLLGEAPWQGPLRHPEGWDIAVAPLAHSTGALAGAVLAWLLGPQPPRRCTSEVVE
jgi:rhomboid family GlyGly-CTERM serine protease